MSEVCRFYWKDLVLTVYNTTYLVEVERAKEPPAQDKLEDLPEWTLHSRNAIWLLNEDAPIVRRAMNGESIRKELLENIRASQLSKLAV